MQLSLYILAGTEQRAKNLLRHNKNFSALNESIVSKNTARVAIQEKRHMYSLPSSPVFASYMGIAPVKSTALYLNGRSKVTRSTGLGVYWGEMYKYICFIQK